MSEKQKYNLARVLINLGALLAFAWGVVSVLGLFDVMDYSAKWYEIVRAIGPAGIALLVLGMTLCRWDLRGMKERVRSEE
jgi:hypothetical protein